MTFPDLDEEVTPEVGDKYVHASVMLCHGIQMMHDTVITREWDHVGKLIGYQANNLHPDMH